MGCIPHELPLLFHGINLCLIHALTFRIDDFPALLGFGSNVRVLCLLGRPVPFNGGNFNPVYRGHFDFLYRGNFDALHLIRARDRAAFVHTPLFDLFLA